MFVFDKSAGQKKPYVASAAGYINLLTENIKHAIFKQDYIGLYIAFSIYKFLIFNGAKHFMHRKKFR